LAANPIFIETEEEIPAVIERIKRTEASEVPLVLPARSRFAQSRFNFQLLRDYAIRMGKHVAIISPDPAVQRMAEESGFTAYRGVDHYAPAPEGVGEAAPTAKVVPLPTQPVQPAEVGKVPKKVSVRLVPPLIPASPAAGEPVSPSTGAGVVSISPAGPTSPPAPAGAADPPQPPVPPASVRPRQPPVRVVPPSGKGTPSRRPPRIKVTAPKPLPSRLAAQRPSRIILYAGAMLVLGVGLVAMVVFVPSAKVTLVTEAAPYNAPVEVSAEPNKAPIRVRTVAVSRDASITQKATGVKTIPGAVATGTVAYSNNCPTGFVVPDGQVLVGGPVPFAQKGAVTIGPKSTFGPPATVGAPAVAKAPGAAGNIPGGAVTLQPAGDAGGCVSAVLSATTGGTDEQKKTVVSTTDFAAARSTMESGLRKQASDDLAKQVQAGEKLADSPVTLVSDFKPSKKVDDEGSDFAASLTLKLEGAFYLADEVNRAFGSVIQKSLPAGQQLTGNQAKIDYTITSATAGGHLTFKGTASAFLSPKIDLAKVKSQLPGKSTTRARADLAKLPGVRSVQIDQSPFKLPVMPLAGSRIDLQYVVSQAPATRSG
jgi:hypothetical protein